MYGGDLPVMLSCKLCVFGCGSGWCSVGKCMAASRGAGGIQGVLGICADWVLGRRCMVWRLLRVVVLFGSGRPCTAGGKTQCVVPLVVLQVRAAKIMLVKGVIDSSQLDQCNCIQSC